MSYHVNNRALEGQYTGLKVYTLRFTAMTFHALRTNNRYLYLQMDAFILSVVRACEQENEKHNNKEKEENNNNNEQTNTLELSFILFLPTQLW